MNNYVEIRTSVEHFHSKLWGHHFKVPSEVAQAFIEENNRRIICTLNDVTFRCALMPKDQGFFVLLNEKVRNAAKLEEGDLVNVRIEKDSSEYGHEVPESFEALLSQDEEGRQYFENLSKGKQRSLVYMVSQVKSVDKQINKGLAIMHHLKESQGQLDGKRLNELIKIYNNRL